jgi:AsmA protein
MKKILLITTALVLVLVIVAAVFTKIYITPEKVKAFLVPEVEKALNRKISIEELQISIFKGIEARNFAVKEADGETDFLISKEFILKYKLLPLLSKKVIIDEWKILSPEIKILRDGDGKYNFESIGKSEKAEAVKEEREAAESSGLPVSLLVRRIVFKDARFSLTDDRAKLPDVKGIINIDTGITSTGTAELFSKGRIDIRLEEIKTRRPEKRINDIFTELTYEVMVNLESSSLRIVKADIEFQKIPVSLTGRVHHFRDTPEIDISVLLPETKTEDIMRSLSQFVDTQGVNLIGDLTADLTIKGVPARTESLRTDGTIRLIKVSALDKRLPAVLDGKLQFKGNSLDIDLTGAVGKNTVEIKGSVKNLFKDQDITLNLYSRELVLEDLIPAGSKGSPSRTERPSSQKERAEEAGPLDLKITAGGEVKIDSALYKGLKMNDFRMRYQFKNNMIEIKEMTALAGKGRLNVIALADLSRPGYQYQLSTSIESLHADEVINSLFPKARDTVFGVLSLNLKLGGTGTVPASIKKNLKGNGDFSIRDGKITNNRLSEKLAGFLGIEELRTINLNEARGTVNIKDGAAALESIFSSNALSMDPSGDIGLDETLALELDLRLSPSLTDKAMRNSNIASYIKDEEGWGRIPLTVSGTFKDPSYRINAAKAGKRVIKKKAGDMLREMFEKKNEEEEDKAVEEKGKQDSERPLKDVFEKLF